MLKLAAQQRPADSKRLLAAIKANAELFDLSQPIHAARAPGRLDLMGGIADYSGALVLELPLGVATYAAMQRARHNNIVVRSLADDATHGSANVSIPLPVIAPDGEPLPYANARALLAGQPATAWAAYVLGPLLVLMREKGVRLNSGLNILIASDVPAGKGVSSSAAIEVATMRALCAMTRTKLDGRALAILCQKAENLVVGAPCGVMDQMTSACGIKDSLLALHCQPAELQAPVYLPKQLAVWGIDSGVRHAVSGADYGSVRVGAFMGYRIIADAIGLPVKAIAQGRVEITDKRTGGYLANITPSEWEAHLRERVPVEIGGADFLARYSGFTDAITSIDPARQYSVRQPTAHPIYENHRVSLFRELLRAPLTAESRKLLGELMFQSHASYSACGVGSEATDLIVELVRRAGPQAGLYGAKITGGGSGGTVAVLGDRTAGKAVQKIADTYSEMTGRESFILSGSSDGAMATGALKVTQG